jgi:hypothetical protein
MPELNDDERTLLRRSAATVRDVIRKTEQGGPRAQGANLDGERIYLAAERNI